MYHFHGSLVDLIASGAQTFIDREERLLLFWI
jgi:hypothetical protein